jgi:4-amino-4-deoxy-L-arabinose transferase-like glycosyltransferase
MKSFFTSLKTNKKLQQKVSLWLVLVICCISLGLNLFQRHQTQACFNADEAAHGYNAYSLLKTARDEYGKFLPIRFKSFGEYKMPLYAYLSIPFIAIMGLTVDAVRAPNTVASLLFPLAVYFLAVNVFHKRSVGLLAASIAATSLGLHSVGRHAHEVYISTLFMVVAVAAFIRTLNKNQWKWTVLCIASLTIAMLGYQAARIYTLVLILKAWVFVWRGIFRWRHAAALTAIVFLLFVPDLFFSPQRVSSLFFFNSQGLHMKVEEYRMEGASKLLFNKGSVAVHDIILKHAQYFTPQFLVERGDQNYRFGYPDMAMVNIVIYAFFLVGLYFIVRTINRDRAILLVFLVVAPLAGSLSWADASITRAFFLLPLLHVVAGFGIYSFASTIHTQKRVVLLGVTGILVGLYLFFQIMSWQIFLYHYPQRAIVIHAQQCGYEEVGNYIRAHKQNTSRFFISKTNGQPYIYTLFFTRFDPKTYQKEATLSGLDKYGFGQVERFDTFEFNMPAKLIPGTVVIGAPEEAFRDGRRLRRSH